MGLVITVSMLPIILLGMSCAPGRDFNTRLSSITKPYSFNIAKWELNTSFGAVKQAILGRDKSTDDEVNGVTEYFSSTEQIKAINLEIEAVSAGNKSGDLTSLEADLDKLRQQKMALEDAVERIIERQIKETLAQQGIYNPIDKYIGLRVVFPPLNFKLDKPPHLLVVSPRDRIESIREVTLRQSIDVEVMESIEAEVDELGVSSLVAELGGFGGTYPAFVTNEASLRFTIDTAAEEWVHQYLAFKPLGFRYLLDLTGLRPDYEIATMNETVASMVSKEIGSIVCENYYPQHKSNNGQTQAASGFDFNREMREIRRAVDKYLAEGEIEQAEEFMEQKRQYLATRGYYLRKLNQAYFAFHGAYADRPTSISPIGVELRALRSKSTSLKDFLGAAAGITSRQDLIAFLK